VTLQAPALIVSVYLAEPGVGVGVGVGVQAQAHMHWVLTAKFKV